MESLAMKMMLVALIAVFAAANAFAYTDYGKTVDQVGVDHNNWLYFSVKEGFSVTCLAGRIYGDISTQFGRAAFAQLLAAKNAGRQLSRIDYTQTGGVGSQCHLTLVEVQD